MRTTGQELDTWLGRWEFKISLLNFGQPCWALKNRKKKLKEREKKKKKKKKNLGEEKERPVEKEK